jgi:hypothetical protein
MSTQGNVETVKWLRENGCPCDWDSVRDWAVEFGDLERLKCLHATGYPWNERTCEHAARYGQLDILKWARENGCPWDFQTCAAAAEGGHIELLGWARANGAPWDEETRRLAASKGYVEAALEAEKESDDPFGDVDGSELSWSAEDA